VKRHRRHVLETEIGAVACSEEGTGFALHARREERTPQPITFGDGSLPSGHSLRSFGGPTPVVSTGANHGAFDGVDFVVSAASARGAAQGNGVCAARLRVGMSKRNQVAGSDRATPRHPRQTA